MIYQSIINAAIEEAKKSTCYPRIGAIIFKGKRIFSRGYNDIRSSSIPMKHRHWPESLHAEQSALLKVDWNKLKGCSILVYRYSKDKVVGCAKPCPMCEKIIRHVGIKNVYYSDDDGTITHVQYGAIDETKLKQD